MTLELTPVLSRTWDQDRSWTREVYERHDGYAGLKAARDDYEADAFAAVRAAIGAAGRVPAVVAEPYSPPGQPS